MDISFNSKSIITGLELVDKQHQKYFQILTKVQKNLEKEFVNAQFFNELYDYIIYHFNCEEQLMDKYNYDRNKTISHKHQHASFKEKLVELHRKSIQSGSIDINLKMKISYLLIDWLVKHIQSVDKDLCEYVLTKSHTDSGLLGKLKSMFHEFTTKYGG